MVRFTTLPERIVGVGLGDEMIRTQIGEDGTVYPPYGFISDDEYRKFMEMLIHVLLVERCVF